MIQSRIDRIYISAQMVTMGGMMEILPEIPDISDHSGVTMHFNNTGIRKTKQTFFNKGLLKHPESKSALIATWREVIDDQTITSWNAKIVAANQAIRKKSDEFTHTQKQKWKATYLAQFDDIIEAEDELQRNWGSKEARERLSDAQAKLHEVRQQKFQFEESATLSKWTRVGDKCTKEFFEHYAGQRRQIMINQLMEGDTQISTQPELERHILSYYESLYTRDDGVEHNEATRQDCLRFVRRTVTAEHNEELLKPLTQEEVADAVK